LLQRNLNTGQHEAWKPSLPLDQDDNVGMYNDTIIWAGVLTNSLFPQEKNILIRIIVIIEIMKFVDVFD
jgi:hypothetical protein